MKRALVFGISGQDGSYLSRLLLEKGYQVFGTSRDAEMASFANLKRLGVFDRVRLLSTAVNDFRSVLQALTVSEPDEVYNLAGQSSVGLSFDQPAETFESISTATLTILEALRFCGRPIRYYSASSSECFGDTAGCAANEDTPFRPRSPYGVAKCSAFWQVANYREAYGLYACSGVLFNHESPLRPARFVTRKIIAAACRIKEQGSGQLELGNLDIVRDWGWAPEYVDAMWRMLQQPEPRDLVIATGTGSSLRDFVHEAFGQLGLDCSQYLHVNPGLFRPTDIAMSIGDASRAAKVLRWRPVYRIADIVREMLAAEASR